MTKHNALSECRAAVNRQIQFLEHELGIAEAFPTTIGFARLSQDLTRQINALPAAESTPTACPICDGSGEVAIGYQEFDYCECNPKRRSL